MKILEKLKEKIKSYLSRISPPKEEQPRNHTWFNKELVTGVYAAFIIKGTEFLTYITHEGLKKGDRQLSFLIVNLFWIVIFYAITWELYLRHKD